MISQEMLALILISAGVAIMMVYTLKILPETSLTKLGSKLSTTSAVRLVILGVLSKPGGWVLSDEHYGLYYNYRAYTGLLDIRKIIADCLFANEESNDVSCVSGNFWNGTMEYAGEKIPANFSLSYNITLSKGRELEKNYKLINYTPKIFSLFPKKDAILDRTAIRIIIYDLSRAAWLNFENRAPRTEDFLIANFTYNPYGINFSKAKKILSESFTVVLTDGEDYFNGLMVVEGWEEEES